jgi:hypothetical protein
MLRIFGLLAMVLGLWYAAQLYMGSAKQMASERSDPTASSTPRSTAQRAGDRVRAAMAKGTEARERMMPDE